MTEMDPATRRMVLFATSMGSFINPLIASMIVLAMPQIGTEFFVSARDLGWLTLSFLLANAIFLVPGSKIADILGYKRTYIIGALITAVACTLSAFAPSYEILLLLRVVAAVGTSFLMITGLAILTKVYPAKERGGAFGINTAAVYVGGSIGPVLGGVLTEVFGWRSVFLVMVPFAFLAALPLYYFLKENFKIGKIAPFDLKGTFLYAIAMFCLMYGLSTLPEITSFVLAAVGVLLMIVFIWYECRLANPVLHVKLFFTNKIFARSTYAALLNYGCMYGAVFFVSLYLQSIGQLTAAEAGMVVFFQPLIQAVMTPIAGKFSDKINPKYLVTTGMILSTLGILLLAGLTMQTNVYYIVLTQVFIGLGVALFSAPNTNIIMSSVPANEYSTASSMIAVMRQVGMILSMAICMSAISIFVGGNDMLGPEMYEGFLMALKVSMFACAGLAVVGIYFSWFRGDAPQEDDLVTST